MKKNSLKVAIINVDFENASAGALARQLFYYGKNEGHTMFAFYGRGSKYNEDNIYKIESLVQVYIHKILTLLTGCQGCFSNFATTKLLYWLKKKKIEKVILIQMHGYYINETRVLNYLKKNKIDTIYITSDEYAGLGKCCYSQECDKYTVKCHTCEQIKEYPKSLFFDSSEFIFKRKLKVYSGFENIVFAGPETNLAKFRKSALLKSKNLAELNWGIDTECYKYYTHEVIYDKYNIPRDKIYILTVAPYSEERKGVKKYFFEVAKKLIGSKYHFIHVGFDCNREMDYVPENCTAIPYIKDQKELAQIYSLSDLYLLASMQDTMPLTCLMALACETPIGCFYTSGLKYLAPKGMSIAYYTNEYNVDGLLQLVAQMQKKTENVRRACREYALAKYSKDLFNKKVFELIGKARYE